MVEKDRNLSRAEEKRRYHFEKMVKELEEDGYVRKELTFSGFTINILAPLVTLPIIGIMYLIYWAVGNEIEVIDYGISEVIVALLFLGGMVLVHECIHGIVWAIYARGHFSSIAYGMAWEGLSPYCTCNEPLTKGQNIIALAMPVVVQGVIPAMIAILNGWDTLFLIALMMIMLGGGDIICIGRLVAYKTRQNRCMFIDHPYKCGFVVMEKGEKAP